MMHIPHDQTSAGRPVQSSTVSRQSLDIFLCGDVMTGRGIDQALPHPSEPGIHESYMKDARGYLELAEEAHGLIPLPVGFQYIWGDALPALNRMAPDVRIINLETSITRSNDFWKGKGINYRMSPDNIPVLAAAAVDACALANNHVLDWGYEGLADTFRTLRTAGIRFAGAGRNAVESRMPTIIDVKEKGRVIVFSFGTETSGIPASWAAGDDKPGVWLLKDLSPATVLGIGRAVWTVKGAGDVVVASIHWGGNWGYEITAEELRFAHALVDTAGIDIVHGHSSHHFRGIEVYRGKPILYGCGDFINDYEGIGGYKAFRGDLALMYVISIETTAARLADFRIVPLRLKRFRLNLASGAEVRWISETLNREGKRLGTRVAADDGNVLQLRWQRPADTV